MIMRPGDVFAGCRILSLCGSGGMGIVYLAEDFLHRKVALKIVALNNAERELRGIQQYISAAEKIPGMVRIHHAGIEQEQLVYIMEAADPLNPADPVYTPKTLSALLKQHGKLPPHQVLEIIRYLGESLRQLHDAHLIHRDIKPENIIFVNGVPKLCDPGLVCCQDASISFAGTLGYLPHECFDGENLNSPVRDLYALGMVFYVAVTGEVPSRYPRLPGSLHIAAQRKLWPLIVRVCNSNPKRRFASTKDFLAALPAVIPAPNWFDRRRESFREYCLLHPRFLLKLTISLLLILLCSTALVLYQVQSIRKRAAYVENCRQQCVVREQKLNKSPESLLVQIEAYSGTKAMKEFRKLLKNLSGDPVLRCQQLKTVEKQLEELALRMVPEIPEKTDDAGAELLSSKVRSLLSSPLGIWLPSKTRNEIKKKTVQLEKLHITKGTKLKAGSNFSPVTDYSINFVYVPAGVYRDSKGKIVRINHAFWCGDTEVSTFTFSQNAGNQWNLSNKELPQVKFSWNDLIDVCRDMTIRYRQTGILPEGYIFRPLTTKEWFWAYQNAWYGAQEQPKKQPPGFGGRARTVYSGTPNLLGLYNMLDNVQEITIPEKNEKVPNHIHICGNGFIRYKATPGKADHLQYQNLPPYIGSRIAVARGDLDFFERVHWYMEEESFQWHNRIFHCIDAHISIFSQQDARELCELMGGHLTVPDDPEFRNKVKTVFIENYSFPFAIDIMHRNGKLVTSSGKPYLHTPVPASPSSPKMTLSLFRGIVQYVTYNGCAGFICEWSAEEYKKRTDPSRILKSRRIMHTFKYGNKIYALVNTNSIIYAVRQISMILGAKLAEPSTPELRERMKKELAPWKNISIFLGGYRKFDRWVLSDGSELKMDLKHKGFFVSNGFNPSAPGLQDGEFCALQKAQAFLLEFPLQ